MPFWGKLTSLAFTIWPFKDLAMKKPLLFRVHSHASSLLGTELTFIKVSNKLNISFISLSFRLRLTMHPRLPHPPPHIKRIHHQHQKIHDQPIDITKSLPKIHLTKSNILPATTTLCHKLLLSEPNLPSHFFKIALLWHLGFLISIPLLLISIQIFSHIPDDLCDGLAHQSQGSS